MVTQETLDCWAIRGLSGILKFLESRPSVPASQKAINLAEHYKARLSEAIKKLEVANPERLALEESLSKHEEMKRWFLMGLEYFVRFFKESELQFDSKSKEWVAELLREFQKQS